MNPLQMIEPFRNFEKLCPDLVYQYRFNRDESERDDTLNSLLPYKDIEQMKEHIALLQPFKTIEPFDKTRKQEIADILNILYRKILEQPFWYLEAVELHPDSLPAKDKLFERAKSVFYRIEHAQDKFNEMIVSVKHQIRDHVKDDKDSALKLFNEILYVTDRLILSSGRNSFDQWYFDYKRSPLFILLMEFIQEIKYRAGSSVEYQPEIETYLNNISSYKDQFKEVATSRSLNMANELGFKIQENEIDVFDNFVHEEISYWTNKGPIWKNLFEIKWFKSLIKVSAIILKSNPDRFKLMSDFINGLALFPIYIKNKDEHLGLEFDLLTNPVIDLQIKYFKSEQWKRFVIGREVTGQDILQVNDITIPITPEALLLHMQRTNTLVLTTESVVKLERDWRKYIREKYQDEDSNTLFGLSTNLSPTDLLSIFEGLIKLHVVKLTDRDNFIAVFQPNSLPVNWRKIKWCGSRKACFSFMMDMCGSEIEAQTINLYFTQNAINSKTKELNTKPLNPRDRSNCKPGFLSRLNCNFTPL